MYYKRQTYELTESDKVLINALAELLFGRKDVKIDLPFIISDLSCSSPEQLKGHNVTEGSHFDTEALGYYSPAIFTISLLEGERRHNHVASASIMTGSSRKVLETLAQLLTFFVVRDIPEYNEVFKKMTALQSEDYTEFRSYQSIDPWYLFRTMSLVRSIDYTNQTMQLAKQSFAEDRHLKWLLD